MWYLYVLELENQCYYIGITLDIERRVYEHSNTKDGANFTKINKPIKLIESCCCQTYDREVAYEMENEKTLKYAIKYGGDKVKGGRYLVPRKLINKIAHLKKLAEKSDLPPIGGEKS